MLYFKDFVIKFCLAACQEKEVLLHTTKDWLVWCKRSTNTTHAWLGLKLRGEILPSRIKVSILSPICVLCQGKESMHIKGRKSVMGYENLSSQVSCKIDENNWMCMKRSLKSTLKKSYCFRSIESRKLSQICSSIKIPAVSVWFACTETLCGNHIFTLKRTMNDILIHSVKEWDWQICSLAQ